MPTDMQKTLPKGWKWVKLGDVAAKEKFAIRMGPFGSQLKKHELVNEGIKVLWIENIVNNKFEWLDNKCITIDKFQVLKGFQVKPNDILTTTMGTIGRACVVPENIGKAIISSHLLKISPDLHIANPEFISRYLSSDFCQKYFDKSSHGIVMKGLNTTIIKSLPVPFPPLSTQHKIVEILEEADNLRKLRRQADEKMIDLIPSLFAQMFGDPVTNPKGWGRTTVGKICEFVYGSSLPEKNRNDGEIPVYGSNGIVGTHDNAITEGETIIIGRKGSVGEVNFSWVPCFPIDTTYFIDKRYTSQDLIWLSWLLRFLKLEKLSLTVGVPGLNRSHAYKLKIPLPPLPLQQEFAKIAEDIEAEKARQAESKKKLGELFNSLMQRAFTGKIVA